MISTEQLQRILIWLLIAAVSVFLFERLLALLTQFATPLLLFALAWLLTLVLQPLVKAISGRGFAIPFVQRSANGRGAQHWHVPRNIAALLVYFGVVALVIYPAFLLIPIISSQLISLNEAMPTAIAEIDAWVIALERGLNRMGWRVNFADMQTDTLIQQATTLSSTLISQSLTIISGIATLVLNLVLILIISYYMTVDGPAIAQRLLELLPIQWRDDTSTFFAIISRTFGAFLRAQLVQALLYGLATAIIMLALGISDIALASVLAGILVLIPLVGGFFAIIPPLMIALIENPDRLLLMLICLLTLQQVLFNMIMPRLMGKIVGLHPLLIFAAILLGAAFAGAWGLLFGVPVAGVIASLLQFLYLRASSKPEAAVVETPVPR